MLFSNDISEYLNRLLVDYVNMRNWSERAKTVTVVWFQYIIPPQLSHEIIWHLQEKHLESEYLRKPLVDLVVLLITIMVLLALDESIL